MTDTVRVPKAFTDWLYGVEGYGLRVERLSEELRDPADKLLPWLLAAFEVGLAASPQGEGSSAHPAPIKPSGDTGELRERVARIIDPSAFLFSRDELDAKVRHHPHDAAYALADAILDLIQSERAG